MRRLASGTFVTLFSLFAGLAVLYLGVPVLVVVIRAVAAQGWQAAPDGRILSAVGLSIFTTLVSTAITIVVGTPLAYLLATRRFRGKRLIQTLVELPIVLPPAVAGIALLITFGRRGLLGPLLGELGISIPFTTAAVVFAQIFVSAPLYIRAAVIGFQGVPNVLWQAATVDGASEAVIFRKIALPLAARGMVSGAISSWARAMGEFGATIFFAGSLAGTTQTMPLLIYGVFERDIDAALWTSVILIALSVAALLLAQLAQPDKPSGAESD